MTDYPPGAPPASGRHSHRPAIANAIVEFIGRPARAGNKSWPRSPYAAATMANAIASAAMVPPFLLPLQTSLPPVQSPFHGEEEEHDVVAGRRCHHHDHNRGEVGPGQATQALKPVLPFSSSYTSARVHRGIETCLWVLSGASSGTRTPHAQVGSRRTETEPRTSPARARARTCWPSRERASQPDLAENCSVDVLAGHRDGGDPGTQRIDSPRGARTRPWIRCPLSLVGRARAHLACRLIAVSHVSTCASVRWDARSRR